MTDLSELRFFQTAPHKCGYLDGKEATNIFVDPELQLNAQIYNFLSTQGFRRSGNHVYRPHCGSCSACIPYRVLAKQFSLSKSQRRCINRNKDLAVSEVSSIYDDEYYQLYEHYITARHRDGEMFPPDREQYESFLTNEWSMTKFVTWRDTEDRLLSVAIVDVLQTGLSAMYSFFDCQQPERSLGTNNILFQIKWAQALRLTYVYLGYWIKNCQKMQYKCKFKPYQLFENNQWRDT